MTSKYSIVIPTRNKSDFLSFAIQSVLGSSRSDFELIVSNNYSTDATAQILDEISDPRLRVVLPSAPLSMAGHYEFAISQAKGDWITILGDDDAVMPYIFDSLDSYIDQAPQIEIISSARAYYFWQGCEDLYGNTVVSYRSCSKAQIRSTTKDLLAALKGLRSCFDLPQIYTTGIVKRSLYEEIKEKSGGYFYHSIIPDMYSAVALSLSRDKYLRVSDPLFWVGTSNKSMGRSDRIYRDSEQYARILGGQNDFVPKGISEFVSYILHSSGFGALYIYECLLQCPLSSNRQSLNKLRVTVLAAILNDLRLRSRTERTRLTKEFSLECLNYHISEKQIKFHAHLLWLHNLVLKIMRAPRIILLKFVFFRRISGAFVFYSANRQMFPSILDASSVISDLRASSFKKQC